MPSVPPKRVSGFLRFITSTVVILIATGIVLIIFGVTEFLTDFFTWGVKSKASINNILRTTGAAILGGGVISALVQSHRFTEIFQKVFENVLWSNDFLKRRGDIREVWNNISRLLYQDKFPALSNDIEDIITSVYFPTNHEFYTENYDVTVSISEKNEHFWTHTESISFTIKPAQDQNEITYEFGTMALIPANLNGAEDETNLVIDELIINGKAQKVDENPVTKGKNGLYHTFNLPVKLLGSCDHNIILKRTKTLEKQSNKDKRYFAKYFIKDTRVTVIAPLSMEIDFYSMGTVTDFIKAGEQVNGDMRILKYYYNGLILPRQGFFILVK